MSRMSSPTRDCPWLDNLEVFFGELSPAEARVYAQLPPAEDLQGATLRGVVRGPQSRYARTLQATISLRELPPGEGLLAQAIIPDPCFWTPEAPYLYQVEIEVRRGEEVIASVVRDLGLRPLASTGRRLRFAGQNFVLRAVHLDAFPPVELSAWHDAQTAMYMAAPADALCAQASETGVLLVAEVSAQHEHLAGELRRLARHAAVGLIVLTDWTPDRLPPSAVAPLGRLARNVVLARPLSTSPAALLAAQAAIADDWAHVVVADADEADEFFQTVARSRLPVVAQRPCAPVASLAEGRAACDQLQRDLAGRALSQRHRPGAEVVGYIV